MKFGCKFAKMSILEKVLNVGSILNIIKIKNIK